MMMAFYLLLTNFLLALVAPQICPIALLRLVLLARHLNLAGRKKIHLPCQIQSLTQYFWLVGA